MHCHLVLMFLLRMVRWYILTNFVTGTRSHRLISSATLQLVLLDVVIAVHLMRTLIPFHRHGTPLPKEHLLRNTEVVQYVSVSRFPDNLDVWDIEARKLDTKVRKNCRIIFFFGVLGQPRTEPSLPHFPCWMARTTSYPQSRPFL